MKGMAKHGFILGVICIVATGLLAAVNQMTAPRIAGQAEAELQASLKDVLPQASRFESVDKEYYRALDADGQRIGVAFIAEKKGYSSQIQTLVGMKTDGTITAIKVINQNETPGLGTRITEVKNSLTFLDLFKGKKKDASARPWFCEQFRGRDSGDLGGVQAITGATISSRAVIEAVKEKAAIIKGKIANGG